MSEVAKQKVPKAARKKTKSSETENSRRITATELRAMPKRERDRELNRQFREAKQYYEQHPEFVIQASQDIIEY